MCIFFTLFVAALVMIGRVNGQLGKSRTCGITHLVGYTILISLSRLSNKKIRKGIYSKAGMLGIQYLVRKVFL